MLVEPSNHGRTSPGFGPRVTSAPRPERRACLCRPRTRWTKMRRAESPRSRGTGSPSANRAWPNISGGCRNSQNAKRFRGYGFFKAA